MVVRALEGSKVGPSFHAGTHLDTGVVWVPVMEASCSLPVSLYRHCWPHGSLSQFSAVTGQISTCSDSVICVSSVCHLCVICVSSMCHLCVICVSSMCHLCVICVSSVCHLCVKCVSSTCHLCVKCQGVSYLHPRQ